jgi:hypothetical protein
VEPVTPAELAAAHAHGDHEHVTEEHTETQKQLQTGRH